MRIVVTAGAAADIITGVASSTASEEYTRRFLIKNLTATATVYLENVKDGEAAPGTSFPWVAADGALSIEMEPGEHLRGIVAAGGADQELRILRTGR